MLTDNPNAALILIVEDDASHVELMQRSFEDAPEEYRLEIAGTLLDAWKVIEQHSPHLVLTDYLLPDGDGNELVVMVNEACPVVMMSSHGNEQIAVEAIKFGAQDYIVKSPAAFEALPRTVSSALKTWTLILARRQADAVALRARRDWERTFDAVPDLISIIDLNHTITRTNKAMADRCGLTPQELVGRRCCEVVHALDVPPAGCPVAAMMRDGHVHHTEIEEKCINGIFDVTVSPLFDEEGRLTSFVHVMQDITGRKKGEQERIKLELQFQQTQKLESLGVLAGGIAHDFNNILTIILGHCYILKEAFDSGMTAKEHVQLIESAGNRAAELCRQMLAYAGQSPQLQTKVNLWLLVDEVVKMLKSAIKKNVKIELDLRRDVPEITGDIAQIQQIIMNLIINAAEAIGDKNGTIKIALRKATIQGGDADTDFIGNAIMPGSYACLEVADSGCGIDAATQKRIFEPFFTTKFTGRGLGMSAVLGIVKSHDGALQLVSTAGSGTTFTVYFPLSVAPAAVETAPQSTLFPLPKGKSTVLLVDDEEALRIIGSALLNAMGYSTLTAANGRDALDVYRGRGSEIGVILLDLIMPEMGGLDTYHELRKMNREVPIVFCSGYGIEGILENIDSDNCVGAIQKPYKPEQLRSTIQALLGPNSEITERCL